MARYSRNTAPQASPRERRRGLRSSLITASAAVVLTVGLAACAPASTSAEPDPTPSSSAEQLAVTPQLIDAAKKEGEVYFRYSAQQNTTEAIAKAFTDKYGIKVNLDRKVRAEGTQLFASEERADKHVVDVHMNTDRAGYLDLIKEGLYARITVPDIASKFPAGSYIDDYAIAPYLTEVVLTYNRQKLSTADATSVFSTGWKGLLDPKLSNGRIGLLTPAAGSQVVLWYWGLAEKAGYGEAFLQQVATQKPVIVTSSAQGCELLNAGEISVLVGDVLDQAETSYLAKAPIQWTYLDPSPSFATVTTFISAKAPHPNAARLFLAWLLSADGAQVISNAQRTPTLKTTVTPNPVKQKLQTESWWKPYPDNVRFAPTYTDQDEKYTKYEQAMTKTFNIPVS